MNCYNCESQLIHPQETRYIDGVIVEPYESHVCEQCGLWEITDEQRRANERRKRREWEVAA